jgi:hypothetical protein
VTAYLKPKGTLNVSGTRLKGYNDVISNLNLKSTRTLRKLVQQLANPEPEGDSSTG